MLYNIDLFNPSGSHHKHLLFLFIYLRIGWDSAALGSAPLGMAPSSKSTLGLLHRFPPGISTTWGTSTCSDGRSTGG